MSISEENITSLLKITDEDIVRSSDWYKQLKENLDYLITHDFSRLIYVLYLADVPEQKLKRLLEQDPNKDASSIIANLMLQRQIQKMEARRSFIPNTDIQEDEKW